MQTCVQAGIEAGHVQRGSAGCLCGDFPSPTPACAHALLYFSHQIFKGSSVSPGLFLPKLRLAEE